MSVTIIRSGDRISNSRQARFARELSGNMIHLGVDFRDLQKKNWHSKLVSCIENALEDTVGITPKVAAECLGLTLPQLTTKMNLGKRKNK